MPQARPQRPEGQAMPRALEQVGQKLQGFFQQRAQQQYTRGVSAVNTATNRMAEIEELRADPDFEVDPQTQAALNEQYQYWSDIARSAPGQALQKFENTEPPAAQLTKEVTTRRKRMARMAQAPPGIGPDRPPDASTPGQGPVRQVTEQQTREVTQEQPARQFITGLRRTTAQRGRESELERERELQEIETEADLTLQDQAQIFQAEQRAIDRGHDVDMAELSSELGIDEAKVRATLQDDNARRQYERELRGEITLQDRQEAYSTLAQAQEWYTSGNPAGELSLQNIANSPDMYPDDVVAQAEATLKADMTAANKAYAGQMRAQANEGTLSDVEVRRANAVADLAETKVEIGDQQLRLNELDIDGRELRNRRSEIDNKIAEWTLRDDKQTAAREYIEEAVNLGMPERLQSLLSAKDNPNHRLSELAGNVSEAEINEAMEVAIDSKNLSGRQRELADAEIDQAFRDLRTGELTNRAQLVETIAGSYSPEDIDQMAEDGDLRTLIDEGLLTDADVEAMKGRSNFFRSMENDEINGQRMEVLSGQLETFARPENFPAADDPEAMANMEASLRSTLNEMVEMEYLDKDQVPGIVESYKSGWENNRDAFKMDQAESDARLAQLRSRTSLNNAKEAASAAGGGAELDPSYVNAYRQVVSESIGAIEAEAAQEGCMTDIGKISNEQECQQYARQIRLERDKLVDLGNEMLGFSSPMSGGTAGTAEDPRLDSDLANKDRTLAQIDSLMRRERAGSLTDQEAGVLNTLIESYPGGIDAVMQDLGLPQPQEEPQAQGQDGGGQPFYENRSLGEDAGAVREGIGGFFDRMARGATGAASAVGQYITGGGPEETGGGLDYEREGPGTPYVPPEERDGGEQGSAPINNDMIASFATEHGVEPEQVQQDLQRIENAANNRFNNAAREGMRSILRRYGIEANVNETAQDMGIPAGPGPTRMAARFRAAIRGSARPRESESEGDRRR